MARKGKKANKSKGGKTTSTSAPQGALKQVVQAQQQRIMAGRMAADRTAQRLMPGSGSDLWKGHPMASPGLATMTYEALGSTEAGREFTLCHLHPCGEYVNQCYGIPDKTQAVVATPVFRGDRNIGWDATMFATPPTVSSPFDYDLQLFTVPHAEVDFGYRLRYPSGSGDWSRIRYFRTSYFAEENDGQAITLRTAGYSSNRMVARGLTVHFNAPTLADQGQLIAGQIDMPYRRSIRTNDTKNEAVDSDTYTLYEYYLPQTETELSNQDLLAAQWQAREGIYIPHRFIDPEQFFAETNAGDTVATTASDGTTAIKLPRSAMMLFYDTDFYPPNAIATVNAGTWGGGQASIEDFRPSTSTWGLSGRLNHLSAQSFWLGISNQAKLNVKTRLHLECQVHAKESPVTPYIHRTPQYDRVAMEVTTRIAQSQQHVFFARDNDLSSILKSVGAILPGILEPLGGMLEQTGIPFISQVGNYGRRAGAGLRTFLDG
jgi:hypothetical protein